MKIVKPSTEILNIDGRVGVSQSIAERGQICYKSESKNKGKDTSVFVKKMIKHKHNSVLEMSALTLFVKRATRQEISELHSIGSKYLVVDEVCGDCKSVSNATLPVFVSGTIRAFREVIMKNPKLSICHAILKLLAKKHNILFEDIDTLPSEILTTAVAEKVALSIVKFSQEMRNRHLWIAVKFIINRAVSHEIVRHRIFSYLQESQRYCRYADSRFGNEVAFIKPVFFEEGSREYCLWRASCLLSETVYLELLKTSSPQTARIVLPNSCKTELIVFGNLAQWAHFFAMRTPKDAEPSMREVVLPLYENFKKEFKGFVLKRDPEGYLG